MAALRLLNRKCGRMRAVSAVRRASESAGVSVRRRPPFAIHKHQQKAVELPKLLPKIKQLAQQQMIYQHAKSPRPPHRQSARQSGCPPKNRRKDSLPPPAKAKSAPPKPPSHKPPCHNRLTMQPARGKATRRQKQTASIFESSRNYAYPERKQRPYLTYNGHKQQTLTSKNQQRSG